MSPLDGAAQLDYMLEHSPSAALFEAGDVRGYGAPELEDLDLASVDQATMSATERRVHVSTARFGPLPAGTKVRFAGAAYVVVQTRRYGDGALTRVFLKGDPTP